jgi:hypothetical protein
MEIDESGAWPCVVAMVLRTGNCSTHKLQKTVIRLNRMTFWMRQRAEIGRDAI